MTFFYDLNKRLATLAAKQDAKQISEDVKATAPKSKLVESLDVAEAGYSAKAARAGKDIGKPGKAFSKIAKSAGERYGSKAAGERVAGAVLNKLRHPKEAVEQDGDVMDYLNDKLKDYDAEQTKEGNAFTGALAKTPKGGKFKVGNKEFTDTSSLEEGTCPTCDCSPCKCDSMEESALQAYLGNKKYGKEGMNALRKAGRDHASKDKMDQIRNRYDKMDEADMEEGNEFTGNLAKAKAQHKDEFEVDGKKYKVVEADPVGLGEEEMDEGYAEMDAWLKSREKEKGTGRFDKKKISTGTVYTRKPETFDDPETDPEATGGAPKRKGRPAGTKRAIGAKHSGRSKLASKAAIAEEGGSSKERAYNEIIELLKNSATDINPAIRNRLMRLVRTLAMPEPVAEKAPPGEKAERMVKHIKKSLSKDGKLSDKDKAIAYATTWKAKKAGKVEEEGAKPDFLDADKDGNKKETFKKAVKDKKKSSDKEEKVDETTTSGSVATATAAPKASKGMQFGKGVYESLSTKLETMIAEGMNITANMGTDDGSGEIRKSITVTADGADADKLAELLKMAGLEQTQEVCPGCGEADCGCNEEQVDENSPDWPTKKETLEAQPELRTYSGGLNGPKSTGQSTTPVLASQLRRQASMEEGVKLERTLSTLYKNYKAK